MGNKDIVAGFSEYTGLDVWLPIDLGNGVDIFRGDFVAQVANYGVVRVAAGGNAIVGMAKDFMKADGTPLLFYDDSVYAADQCYALVNVNPHQLYIIRDDGSGTPSASWIGSNADLVVGTGNADNGQSAMELNGSTVATTAALQVKIIRWVAPDNPAADYCRWIVRINQPQFFQFDATGLVSGGAGI